MHVKLDKILFDISFIDSEEKNTEGFYLMNETGEIFKNGACDIFAYALKKRFKEYDICVAYKKGFPDSHYFCKKNDKYIDAEGIFDSKEEMFEKCKTFNLDNYDVDVINEYTPDFSEVYSKTLLNFANEIIHSFDYLYILV